MNWELVIAAGGVAVGAVGAFVAWREHRAKGVELDIERRRFEIELGDRKKQSQAEITAAQVAYGIGGYNAKAIEGDYYFMLKNLGPSWAKHVSAVLRDEGDAPLTNEQEAGYLEAGGERRVKLVLLEPLSEEKPPASLWVKWRDDSGGPYEERSNLIAKWK